MQRRDIHICVDHIIMILNKHQSSYTKAEHTILRKHIKGCTTGRHVCFANQPTQVTLLDIEDRLP